MSADTLRRAAALMRERAEATYLTTDSGELADWHTPADLVGTFDEDGDADHIASWHPAVALAVADLLTEVAAVVEVSGNYEVPIVRLAMDLARAYLGEQS